MPPGTPGSDAVRARWGLAVSRLLSRASGWNRLGKFGHIIGARAIPRRGARLAEKAAREASRIGADVVGRSLGDDAPSLRASPRTELDDPVGRGEELEVVLDGEHGVAQGDQARERREQAVDVPRVKTGGRLVEQKQRASRRRRADTEKRGELQALGFAAGERRRRLAQTHVPEPRFAKRRETPHDLLVVGEEDGR